MGQFIRNPAEEYASRGTALEEALNADGRGVGAA